MLYLRLIFFLFFLVSSPSSFSVTTTVAVVVSVFVLGLLLVAGICTYRRRRKLFCRAKISLDLVEVSDGWEINRGDLMLLEQIGKGFFGMVFRAKFYHSLGKLSKKKIKVEETIATVVACKVLKGKKSEILHLLSWLTRTVSFYLT